MSVFLIQFVNCRMPIAAKVMQQFSFDFDIRLLFMYMTI